MALTFLGALLWCSTFRRQPNLVAVALSHAILAVVIASTLSPPLIRSYRIGPAYWK
jgi:membrane protease YdiL (CAAX protease family)